MWPSWSPKGRNSNVLKEAGRSMRCWNCVSLTGVNFRALVPQHCGTVVEQHWKDGRCASWLQVKFLQVVNSRAGTEDNPVTT